jgi:hypothetical protein
LIVAAKLRFAVKIHDIGKPEARRHEIRSKANEGRELAHQAIHPRKKP